MGKKQKIRSGAGDVISLPGPLDKQIEKSKLVKKKFRAEKFLKNDVEDVVEEEIDEIIEDSKIQKLARKQREFEAMEEKSGQIRNKITRDEIKLKNLDDSDYEFEEENDELHTKNAELMENELMNIKPEDEEAINKFLHQKKDDRAKSLYDLIQEKILEKKISFKEAFDNLNPEVVELYKEVGQVLAKYRCGKIPKAFKIIPNMINWEQILELTAPENWTAAAMLQATRLFSACMSPSMCQRFYNLVLLPRIRDDINEYKKLNYHLYECLFKAIYKPAAFFKGILLPLIDSGTCTLREAAIVGSVLRKISIPVLHAAAAMLKIAEMEYCGSSSLILRILIEKRYTLPFRAIDGLVFSFLKMQNYDKELPVLWHQSLLSFVENYKSDISLEQREALLEVIKVHSHHQITPEISHQLQFAKSRNEEDEANIPDYVKDNGMEF